MICPRNRVLIKYQGSRWRDRMVTPGGIELFLAPTSKVQTEDIKYEGIVLAVPATLTGYRKNDTEVRLKVGDNVWFHYNTMLREPAMEHEGDQVYEVDYADCFCFSDDKGVYPIGDWVLVQKEKDTLQLGGGLLVNPFEEIKKGQGIVWAISPAAAQSLNTEDGPVTAGDRVFFPHDQGAFENIIKDVPLWCVNASIIFAAEKVQ